MGTRVGIGLDIEPPFASQVTTAKMKVCWDGTCRNPEVELFPSLKNVPEGCDETDDAKTDIAVCGASTVPTGGQYGFADFRELPDQPLQVTVVLGDASGTPMLDQQIEVVPKEGSFGDDTCGSDGGLQTGIIVANGQLRERPS